MAAGNSGDIQMNGNVDWNAIAKQTLRYQYDAKRASVCLWFILFFFNACLLYTSPSPRDTR